MNINVEVVWLATVKLGISPTPSPDFNIVGQRSLFRQFGVQDAFVIEPQRFEPAASFHEWVTHRIFDGLATRRPPYPSMSIDERLSLVVKNVSASVFCGDIAVVRVAARLQLPAGENIESYFGSLRALRSSKEIPQIRRLIQLTIAKLEGGTDKARDRNYEDYFLIFTGVPVSPEAFPAMVAEYESDIVSLLIGAQNPAGLSAEVVNKVVRANADINTKSRVELMLLNRKGVLLLRPEGSYGGPHQDRFAKTRDLATINQFGWFYLRSLQAGNVLRNTASVEAVAKIEAWIRRPSLIFFSSVSHTLSWNALSRAMLLEEHLAAAKESLAR